MPFLKANDGAELFYNDWGQGRPVVLIHGWPLDADMWEHQALFLARNGCRVIAYDRRGFGRSTQTWDGYTYDQFADDLKSVIETLGLSGVTLVGFSMGGGEVARYLSRHGAGRVAKAVLVSAVTPYLLKTADNPEGVDKSVFDGMVAGLETDRAQFLTGFGKLFFGVGLLTSPVSSEVLTWAQSLAMMASPKATIDCVHAFAETDFRNDMKAFTVPTLIIHGDDDKTVPIEASAKRVAAMIPQAQLNIYAGSPHATVFTDADRVNQDLLAFIAG